MFPVTAFPRHPVYEGELAIPEVEGGLAKYDDEDFAAATKGGNFLPRLQLMTANSEKCKAGEFPINNYALVSGSSFRDLGASVDVLILTWRPKAIEMSDEVIVAYDPKHVEFMRIQEKSEEPNSSCMFGPEFLMYIPEAKEFATFFMGSKSARRESPNVKALMRKAATLKSHKIETKKFTWFAATVVACSSPFEMPGDKDIIDQVQRFNAPPEVTIEKDEDTDSKERAR